MNYKDLCFRVLLVFQFSSIGAQNDLKAQLPTSANFKAYESLHLPDLKKNTINGVVKIAVVDCGFNLYHQCIKDFIYRNPTEILNNNRDDDQNGLTDDISGWDFADQDNSVSIPPGREEFFFHGTMIAGAITQVAERCFGAKASEIIKIVPIKVLADQAQKSNYELGYEGIRYAVKLNVDIIVCAWNGGIYDQQKYGGVFDEAKKKGILIISSSGNFYSEQCDPPASIASVYAISAVDSSLHKMKMANYGRKIDLVAQGELVYAPHPASNNTYGYSDGTSAAVSLVAGCAAVLKALDHSAGAEQIMDALKNTATPVDSLNIRFGAKLGAGYPDLSKAVHYLLNDQERDQFFSSRRPEGKLIMDRSSALSSWEISPIGGFKGIYFNIQGDWKDRKSPIQFFSGERLLASYSPSTFPVSVFVEGQKVRVQYSGKKGKAPFGLAYEADPIDSSRLYCKETLRFENPQGEFSDGSGPNNYTNQCDCKWKITVPTGKRIKIIFDELNTQAKVDYVSLFDGEYTIPDMMLASFSGNEIPPVIISPSNQVLVWFVTDETITSKGWHLSYTATDENMGVKPSVVK